ncbi:hypothetical protein LUZ60_010802 [Juncus effusus]|nr:hypothetical protein LUZ60_010802 [Juncus effusus]
MEEPLLIPNISRTQPMTDPSNPNPDPSNPKPNPNNNNPPLRCPRCDSSNTKFCYYNNYSLAQPRHFCKSCKRYWTRGGTLRNVPVGGGCRKNKRTKKQRSNSISISTAKMDPNNFISNSINQMFQHNSSPFDGNIAFGGIVPSNCTSNGFDLQNQASGFGFLGQNSPFQNLQQNGGVDEYPILGTSLLSNFKFPFEDLQAMNGGNFGASKDSKGEKEHKTWQIPYENFMDPIGSSGLDANQITSNPFPSYFNNGSVGLSDSANYGSSVPPLF